MTRKEMITKAIEADGFVLGCWDPKMEIFSVAATKKIIEAAEEDYIDFIVNRGRSVYVVEISTVDGEKDFSVLSKSEYISQYGNEKFED